MTASESGKQATPLECGDELWTFQRTTFDDRRLRGCWLTLFNHSFFDCWPSRGINDQNSSWGSDTKSIFI